jgi:hypothetical protein
VTAPQLGWQAGARPVLQAERRLRRMRRAFRHSDNRRGPEMRLGGRLRGEVERSGSHVSECRTSRRTHEQAGLVERLTHTRQSTVDRGRARIV